MAINIKAAINSLFNRTSSSGYSNYLMFSNHAQWLSVADAEQLFKIYHSNPVYFSTIQIKARAFANMELWLVDKNTEEIIPKDTKNPIAKAAYKLINKPNPLQSKFEFLKQLKIQREVAGNSFTYANIPIGYESMPLNVENISSLINVWPQYMKVKLLGSYFDATSIYDIVDSWRFEFGAFKKTFDAKHILHRNESNTNLTDNYIFGTSIGLSLQKPLSNIDLAYESRNVMIKNRGMRAILSSNKGDATGNISLQPSEIKDLQDAMKKYGTLEDQSQFFFASHPLNATIIDQDVRKLGLFEEIATDAMIVAAAHGVPEILLKLYLQGATFENQEASVRRLYQDTIIPEAADDVTGLNSFLGLDETEFMFQGYFDHIPVLQKNEKEKATANKEKSVYYERLFLNGGCTINEWRQAMDLEHLPDGDKLIWDLDPEQLAIILRKTTQSNGKETND